MFQIKHKIRLSFSFFVFSCSGDNKKEYTKLFKWEDDIKMNLKDISVAVTECMTLAQNRDRMRVLDNTVLDGVEK